LMDFNILSNQILGAIKYQITNSNEALLDISIKIS